MGSTVEVKCTCGLLAEVDVGSGMTNFEWQCLFPFACRTCGKVFTEDLMSDDPRCRSCGGGQVKPFTEKELCVKKGKRVIASWRLPGLKAREVSLTDGYYRCPSCKQGDLRFSGVTALWD